MPLFRGVEWPRDHRDELVAGALVAAVVIVLGYASGIGAPTASGAAEAAVPPVSSPAATAPEATAPAAGQVPTGSGALPGYGGAGADVGYGGTGSDIGYGDTGSGVTGTGPVDGSGGQGGGHTGHESSPPAGTPTPPTPTPTPSSSATCEDGEVALVQPLLVGLTEPVLGLLGGATASPSPTPSPSPCVGLAPVSGLLGGALAGSPSASPRPEVTP
ncbi:MULTISPECIES: hypothetical protein [Streptomyces]|uniref:Secreted protein n=1 Tax=Streptomyces sviceus (strain ATCC 29083 / DSM 924 / JCM 4929 / NBRC 13980 / NCIMB 11184 / NRRL 5439 / UC 5370) TaxID=463191 RepID=D6XBP2_STRX2|nr:MULTISPECIES: hypothetical protein [Streptomyces]EFH28680.1 predicted protein [Streptomyces sviceus ATCC 29083]MYT06274.1 hypothetical protein [Streptomyces sp. SID5470]